MQIIDAQVHIWGSGTPSGHHRQTSVFTAEELIQEMDAGRRGRRGAASAKLGSRLQRNGDRGGEEISGTSSASSAGFRSTIRTQRKRIETWKQQPGHAGTALVADAGGAGELAQGRHDGLAVAGGGDGRPPVATMAWRFLPLFRQIAERHPQPEADHRSSRLGALGEGAAAFATWTTCAAGEAAERRDQGDRCAGHSDAAYPFRDIHDGLHRIFDAFGPNRFFWGTDITRMPCSYRQCVTMFTEELPWLKGNDLELVMGTGGVGLAGVEAQAT